MDGKDKVIMPQMYSRVFLQILDSSLADDWQTRHVFEDLLKLCNMDGVVDMTRQAIARRTNVPLDVVTHAIDQLESADKNSRDVENEGRRIIRLDEHRDWGWRILNWTKYESIRVQNDMRAFNAARMRNYRSKRPPQTPPENNPQPHPQPHPQGVAHTEPTCSTTHSPSVPGNGSIVKDLKASLADAYKREFSIVWPYEEETALAGVVRRHPDVLKEWAELKVHFLEEYFPQSILKLLDGWDCHLDRYRKAKKKKYVPGSSI